MDGDWLPFLELTFEEITLLESAIAQSQVDFTSISHFNFLEIMDDKEKECTDGRRPASRCSEMREEVKMQNDIFGDTQDVCSTSRSRAKSHKIFSPLREVPVFLSPRKDTSERDSGGKVKTRTPRRSQKTPTHEVFVEPTLKQEGHQSGIVETPKMSRRKSLSPNTPSATSSLSQTLKVKNEAEEDIQVEDVVLEVNSGSQDTDLQVVYESRRHPGRRPNVRPRTIARSKAKAAEGPKRTVRLVRHPASGRWTRSAQRNAQCFMLQHAVANGDTGAVTALVKSGVSVFTPDESGRTSLHLACEMGRLDIMRVLLGVDAPGHAPSTSTHPRPVD